MSRVLVIEDEDPLRSDILETLHYEGFEGHGAENGLVGVQKARELHPDVIVCDVMMPGMDGYEVLKELREKPETETLPFIFLTALGDRVYQRKGMEGGADDYVSKPFQTGELMRAIKKQMEKKAARAREFEGRMKDIRDSIFQTLPHEIRTPLMSILGYAELLVESPGFFQSDQIVQMADSIYQAGVRLHRLTENYLLASQLQVIALSPDTVARLRSQVVDRPVVLVEDTAIVQTRHHKREADLKLELRGVPTHVASEHLKKIMLELVDNACKFSAPGTPVTVQVSADEQFLTVAVSNHGDGMTEEEIASIGLGVQFNRDLKEQQGNGLGLFIIKQLATLYGGVFEVASVPGQMTTVCVTLPRVQ